MPRGARVIYPNVAVHVTQRGNNRGRCFFSDGDRLAYLRLLRQFAASSECALHAYCLMPNHVHLLLTPQSRESCAALMKSLGQHYVQHVNRVQGRTGTLWEGRFWSSVCAAERYVLACYRYIELNPVRAGLSDGPAGYPWSSYRSNAQGERDDLLAPHECYLALAESPAARRRAYVGLFAWELGFADIDEIRRASRSGRPMGAARKVRGRPGTAQGGKGHPRTALQ
jgi:putative transposase